MSKLCANYPGERETNTRTIPRSSFSLSQFSISLFEKSDTIGRIPIPSTRIVVIYIVGRLCQYRTAYLLLLRSRRRLTLPTLLHVLFYSYKCPTCLVFTRNDIHLDHTTSYLRVCPLPRNRNRITSLHAWTKLATVFTCIVEIYLVSKLYEPVRFRSQR